LLESLNINSCMHSVSDSLKYQDRLFENDGTDLWFPGLYAIHLTVSVRPSISMQGVKSVYLNLDYTNIPLNSFAKILLVIYL